MLLMTLYQSGHYDSAMFRARYTIDSSIDTLLYAKGFTNPKGKHRLLKMKKLIDNERDLSTIYERYWKFQSSLPSSLTRKKEYIKEALMFSSSVIEMVQSSEKW